ncbi:protein DELAY OF GERMINATION 1 [Benincasa hispida]|uniref:protein DELAY OF GERMINATION 1 n=1 Tax=Benincasa hispida TaxID=102211 RepID=UPI001901448F|nr:protein DELAY OF GERMINATION 1 [Benincasa hispida]
MATDRCSSTKKEEEEDDGSTSHEERSRCCFQEWMQLQREDLTHLLLSLHTHNHEETNKNLIRNCITHFEDYITSRRHLAQEDVSPFFAPTWCTSLENSLLWIAGCRPSIFIRLVYALCGSEADARLGEWLEGVRNNNSCHVGGIGELSPTQMVRVNGLHMRTIKAEEKLTSEMASSQEDVADQPIAVIVAKEMEGVGEESEETKMALEQYEKVMREVMEKADELRLNTLKELVLEILKPIQALEFLVASKKLHLSLHQWGKRRDEKQGRLRSYLLS